MKRKKKTGGKQNPLPRLLIRTQILTAERRDRQLRLVRENISHSTIKNVRGSRQTENLLCTLWDGFH